MKTCFRFLYMALFAVKLWQDKRVDKLAGKYSHDVRFENVIAATKILVLGKFTDLLQ